MYRRDFDRKTQQNTSFSLTVIIVIHFEATITT